MALHQLTLISVLHVACLCLTSANVKAQQAYEIIADGSEYSLTVGAEIVSQPVLSLFFISEGRETTAVSVSVEGPAGLRGAVDGVKLERGDRPGVEMFQDSDRRDPYVIWEKPGGPRFTGFLIDTRGAADTVSFLYHLHKDACARDISSRYVSRLALDFGGVNQERLIQGLTIRFAIREYRHQGSKVATIKPASHGRFFGEPILLMATLRYGGETVRIIQRRSKGVGFHREIPVVKYVSYRGHMLSLARLRGILSGGNLRGGKATFELSSGSAVYGVCFDLIRRRQVANGYPIH